jgi:hypothetical protein
MKIIEEKTDWILKTGQIVELENNKKYLIIDNSDGFFNWELVDLETMKVEKNIRPDDGGIYFVLCKKAMGIKHVYCGQVQLTHRYS